MVGNTTHQMEVTLYDESCNPKDGHLFIVCDHSSPSLDIQVGEKPVAGAPENLEISFHCGDAGDSRMVWRDLADMFKDVSRFCQRRADVLDIVEREERERA